ncbi:hypothetical protein QQ73_02765 [Candidatus Endoriftia persephone str. Guaymas]|nr:hypothetical protein [Candidatus Endoriftia persephone str. Guaymas]
MTNKTECNQPEQPQKLGGSDSTRLLGTPIIPGKIIPITDDIDERLEELSAIAAAWQKNRDKKRASPMLRRALLMCAEELTERINIKLVKGLGFFY